MSLNEIGQRLRERREELGLTLRDAQAATKIRLRYLEALEAGDEAALPGYVYTKGFLRSYANFLQLDGPALVEEYRRAVEGEEETGEGSPRPRTRRRRKQPTWARRAPAAPAAPLPRALSSGRRKSRRGLGWLVLIFLFLVTVGGIYFLYIAAQSELPEDEPGGTTTAPAGDSENALDELAEQAGTMPGGRNESAPPATGEAGTGESGQVEPVLVAQPAGDGEVRYLVAADRIEVRGDVSAPCWVRVEADGRLLYEGTLRPGTEISWQAERELRARIGYPAGIRLTVAGEPIEISPRNVARTLLLSTAR